MNFDYINALYENYKKWNDEAKVKDQPLPGFLLSNEQMFWMVLIHKNCIKLQPGEITIEAFYTIVKIYSPGFTEFSNGHQNADAYFKVNKNFQKSFGCDLPDLSREEVRELKTLFNNFY